MLSISRLKERKKAGTRVAAIRVLIVILAAALVSALIWLLLFSSVFRLETSQISVSGGNEWVSEKDVLDIANQQSGKSLFLVSADKVSSQLKNIPGVTQANVVKRYPRSLEIDIKAQQPAAMLKEPDGTLVAVDRKARVLVVDDHRVVFDGVPREAVDFYTDLVRSKYEAAKGDRA